MSLIEPKHIAIVPARQGSKGLKNKNFLNFCGRPLYQHAVEQALRVADECILSTDNSAILKKPNPNEKFMIHSRPPQLAADKSPIDQSLIDVIKKFNLKNQTIILLQPTSPLRTDAEIEAALALYKTGNFDLVISVCSTEPKILKSGFIHGKTFIPVSKSKYFFMNRQSLPSIFKPNGAIFIFDSTWFLKNKGFETEKIGHILMDEELSLDIDDEKDFKIAERLFCSHINSNTN